MQTKVLQVPLSLSYLGRTNGSILCNHEKISLSCIARSRLLHDVLHSPGINAYI